MKYLKVTVETPFDTHVRYVPLEDDREYSQDELEAIGQDTVNNLCPWSMGDGPIDESEVPEDERIS